MSIRTGEVLARQGELATEAFYVQEGTADVFLETSVDHVGVGSASEKRKIQEVAAGEFIGEVALVLDEVRVVVVREFELVRLIRGFVKKKASVRLLSR